jgi:tetratricopeptide (TPR) repeat protein
VTILLTASRGASLRSGFLPRSLLVVLSVAAGCKRDEPSVATEPVYRTTAGAIALRNLEHSTELAERQGRKEELLELLLMKSQFLGQHAALDRAAALAEEDPALRPRVDGALHRFADALPALAGSRRATVLVALGRAEEALAPLEEEARKRPSFESRSALATALAALGRFEEADRAYAEALASLRSTSPFPFAWVYFSRGVMWAERAGDDARGREMYRRALEHLPEYAVANVHLAELEVETDPRAAVRRLEKVIETADDPEPLALLGELYVKSGDVERGRAAIAKAKARYEELLAKHPLAFADHAAEFFLGPGEDAERAWSLAKLDLENRETERSLALAIRAARAAGEQAEACALVARAKAKRRTGVELAGLLEGC